MSSTKPRRLAVPFGLALLATAVAAHAASVATPSFAAAIAPSPATTTPAAATSSTSVHVVHTATTSQASAPVNTHAIAPASTGGEPTQAASAAPAAPAASGTNGTNTVAAVTGDSHLTLHDIDELARSKLTRALRGDGDAPASSASVSLKTLVPAAPTASAPAPVVQPFVPRERTTPVTFVGAYTDAGGQHVLYQYNGAVYPARVGEKLLNGWIARRIDGLSVTVAQGKHTWSVPMSGGAQESTGSTFVAGSALGDLSSPLPPGANMAQPISSFGRQ
ncbi:hypothetical protein [Paraburkholderia sp. J94]|uniref:hypothetical protein n=1 Tax=Paraburkholderia sp. J94 TaxID=2805441 RepID=UPI002AB1A8EF|nr:hypothetical protein [Paraburkholderia sp. J94]